MNRSMCGGFLLVTLAGLAGCNGDPTGDLIGAGAAIQASPSTVFVAQGDTKPVTISVSDSAGNEQAITGFQASSATGDITVAEDTTFLATTNGSRLATSRRLNVTAVNPAASSISIAANGQTLNIPVVVEPVGAPVTLSANAVPANVPITITLGTGYKFGASGGAQVNGVDAIPQSVAADSSAISVLPPPGTIGPLTLSGVVPGYAPTLSFDLPTADSVSVDSLAPAPGTGSPSTAPALLIPAAGATSSFFDIGTFTAADLTGDCCSAPGASSFGQYYKLDITEAGTYGISVNWANTSDIDILLCNDTACSAPDFLSKGNIQPEEDTRDLTPGTYYLAVVLFAGSPPATISVTLTH
jgi:hypothetical protein